MRTENIRVPSVLVDFDNTLFYEGDFPEVGPPMEGAREAMKTLMGMGFIVRVFTCRVSGHTRDDGTIDTQIEFITAKMKEYDIPFDSIVMPEEGKPFSDFITNKVALEKLMRKKGYIADKVEAFVDSVRARREQMKEQRIADKIAQEATSE